jgi:hypothetical protein
MYNNEAWNREKLYKEVWAEPLTPVAKRYNMSDVAIAKACRKLKTPLPGRGYWARVAAGKKTNRKQFSDALAKFASRTNSANFAEKIPKS